MKEANNNRNDEEEKILITQADEVQERIANKEQLEEKDRRYIKEVMSNIKSKMWKMT